MDENREAIPVILDTDIGGDIDDTWALTMMLKCPELDVRLVVSDTGDTTYRSKIIAKVLEIAERSDVPVGIGTAHDQYRQFAQAGWVEDYDLLSYPGTVHDDGVGAIIETILSSPKPVTLVCIGPVPNIAEALRREPRIADHARFVGMHGSVRRGYGGSETPCPECNVVNHTPACQAVFAADWDVTITPVDTCGLVQLGGRRYRRVRESKHPSVLALMENYRCWLNHHGGSEALAVRSSVLFDTVAVYLAFAEELLVMEELGIRVTDDGLTVIDPNAKTVRVATEWRDMDAFKDLLVERLTSE